MNQKIESPNAPKAFGPYSQGILADNLVFVSGQLGIDPQNNELKPGAEEQVNQALKNLQEILEASQCQLANVVRCDIFLTDINDFAKINVIYEKFFTFDPKPARQTAQVVALPKNALIEISCIAVKNTIN